MLLHLIYTYLSLYRICAIDGNTSNMHLVINLSTPLYFCADVNRKYITFILDVFFWYGMIWYVIMRQWVTTLIAHICLRYVWKRSEHLKFITFHLEWSNLGLFIIRYRTCTYQRHLIDEHTLWKDKRCI